MVVVVVAVAAVAVVAVGRYRFQRECLGMAQLFAICYVLYTVVPIVVIVAIMIVTDIVGPVWVSGPKSGIIVE